MDKQDRETIKECFERLQTLNIQPTIENMEKLLQTLYDLREIYQKTERTDDDGRGAENHPE